MRRQLFGMAIGLVLVFAEHSPSAQAPTLRSIMREKLTDTQQLLEGVLTANFTIVDRYADRLGQISYTEVASWQANPQPEYLKQATAFVNAVQGIRRAAVDRNSYAVADEYTNLLNACVSCHVYVRRLKSVRFSIQR